jgi:hypothetical protein
MRESVSNQRGRGGNLGKPARPDLRKFRVCETSAERSAGQRQDLTRRRRKLPGTAAREKNLVQKVEFFNSTRVRICYSAV